MTSTGVIFSSTYHKKQLSPWQIHWLVMRWFIAGRLLVQERWSHLEKTQALMNQCLINLSKISLGNFQHHYLSELLANVCVATAMNRVMVKMCHDFMCMEAGFCQIQSHMLTSYTKYKCYKRHTQSLLTTMWSYIWLYICSYNEQWLQY